MLLYVMIAGICVMLVGIKLASDACKRLDELNSRDSGSGSPPL